VAGALRADVLCLQEFEDQYALDSFNREDLGPLGAGYSYRVVVEGNDPRRNRRRHLLAAAHRADLVVAVLARQLRRHEARSQSAAPCRQRKHRAVHHSRRGPRLGRTPGSSASHLRNRVHRAASAGLDRSPAADGHGLNRDLSGRAGGPLVGVMRRTFGRHPALGVRQDARVAVPHRI
jgi:hypothetical protein